MTGDPPCGEIIGRHLQQTGHRLPGVTGIRDEVKQAVHGSKGQEHDAVALTDMTTLMGQDGSEPFVVEDLQGPGAQDDAGTDPRQAVGRHPGVVQEKGTRGTL